ncbi:MAG: hypothetical protein WA584_18130 [Pyrinomonadaceae bacterium]
MKVYFFLSIIIIILMFHSNTSAQNPIYLEADRLFKNVALLTDRNINETVLENIGRNVEGLNSSGTVSYFGLANNLILLQDYPRDFIISFNKPANAGKARFALEADSLFVEYIIVLYKPSKNFQNDPLEAYVLKIQTHDGRKLLNLDLETRLGKGVEREKKAAELIIEMRENFKEDKLERLRSIIINNSSARLPYPLCLIKGPCPR